MDGTMARKRHKPEEIVAKLREVDVLTDQGKSIAEAVKTIAVTETTYFRWRAEYGGVRPHSSLNYRPPAPESFIPRSGGIVPWASAPAVEGARSPTPNMALETAVH